MGYAEYPFIEVAIAAEKQNMPEFADKIREEASAVSLEAASKWLIEKQTEINHIEPFFVDAAQRADITDELLTQLSATILQSRLLKNQANSLVNTARSNGASWAKIGAAAGGISPQAAHQRWSESGRESHRLATKRRYISISNKDNLQ